jgi:hypothetical protein
MSLLLARNASSLRCGDSVWNLSDFCRAGERYGRRTRDPEPTNFKKIEKSAGEADQLPDRHI